MDFTTFHNIIAGERRSSSTEYSGTSPTTLLSLWPAPVASSDDVDDAVAAAQAAFPSWAAKSYVERTRLLDRFADRYLELADEFTKLLQVETGRSTQASAIEVIWAANWLRYPAQYTLPEKRHEDDEKTVLIKYEPLGTVAAICPWNSIGKIAQAVATGNCVIVKPSPFTPYSALKLVELAQEIFPASVIQALGGDDQLGPCLVKHPGIHKVSFTGSSATGKRVMRACADTLKRLTLELAGNNVSIILDDVDVEQTALQTAHALWFNAGQVCLNARRLFIHESIYEPFVQALVAATNALGGDLASNVGPIQNEMQFQRIKSCLENCRNEGYRFGTGENHKAVGLFVHPVIIDNPPNEASVMQDEYFGPVVSCKPFSSLDNVVDFANQTKSGLDAIIWSKDIDLAESVAVRLDVGSVFINGPPKPDPFVPFGGHKQSGIGVEYGLEGLLGCCQIKTIHRYK
ncbi:hypothetical protein PENVUL_c024G00479 [Penicillium vulpinum]|uniref:aldehyde dehydrogenase (NAD(+)) n=1 Tax=Penicillium vulpinum TaxID=29845 RepID=A0A1V6RVC5_9EURO|nr:hypothetical protein PENVUL_c024G00479 [Penicillium vulpinum]